MRLAWQPDRHYRPVLANGPQVPAEQRRHLVHPRPGHVGDQAGRRAKRKLHEPGRHLPGVDRLEPEPGRGPVRVRRRLYRQAKRRCFLLDEALGWTRRRVMSPALAAIGAGLAAATAYRPAAKLLGTLIAQAVGATTLHRLVQRVGGAASAAEARRQRAVYEQGAAPPSGPTVAERLFVEADGVSIALQRENQRRTELKIAIGYTGSQVIGTDRRGRTRRVLVGKVTYASVEAGPAFWERVWLELGARYDLQQLQQVVLGGDGATWIRGGLQGTADGIFQLDRFHLARELRRVLGARRGAWPAGDL